MLIILSFWGNFFLEKILYTVHLIKGLKKFTVSSPKLLCIEDILNIILNEWSLSCFHNFFNLSNKYTVLFAKNIYFNLIYFWIESSKKLKSKWKSSEYFFFRYNQFNSKNKQNCFKYSFLGYTCSFLWFICSFYKRSKIKMKFSS